MPGWCEHRCDLPRPPGRHRPRRNRVLFVTIPTAWEVVRSLPHRALVLNRSDLHSAFEEVEQPYIRSLEDELARDTATSSSTRAMRSSRPRGTAPGTVPSTSTTGSTSITSRGRSPSLRTSPPSLDPRIGFFGGIDDYVVDLELLEKLAIELRQASLVIVGDATCSMERLTASRTCTGWGTDPTRRSRRTAPGFDVATHAVAAATSGSSTPTPSSCREYLALGLPVVSTAFPEVEHWRDVVAVAEDRSSFVALVRDALEGRGVSSTTERRARVEGATWARQAERLVDLAERIRP